MNTQKILIVEDNPLDVLIGKYFLEKADSNTEIFVAINGKEAITLLENSTFDIIFVDLDMPVMDGFEFIEYFFSGKYTSQTHIVATSSTTNPTAMRRLLKYKILTFVPKPYSLPKMKELKNLVRVISNL